MKVDTGNLTRKTAFIMFYNVFGAVLGYVTLFFVMRLIGTAAWGILGAATGMVGILSILTDFGLSGAHIKKVSEGGDAEKKTGVYVFMKLMYALIFLCVSFVLIFLATNILGFRFENTYLAIATYIIILYYFLMAIAAIFKTILRAYMETTKAIIPDFYRVLVQDLFLIGATLWWVYHKDVPKEWIGVLYTYGYLLSVFAQIVVLSRYVSYIRVKKPDFGLIKEYLLFSLPLGLFGVVGTIQAYTDRAMLQFFWNYREVGAYFGIQKIIVAIMTFAMAVNFVLYPAQSHNFSQMKRERVKHITLQAERYISLFILPVVGFGFVFAPELLNLWNAQLVPYSTVLRILLVYSFLYVINSPYSSQLVSAGKPKENLKAGVVQATLNIVLNGILIPTSIFGITLFGLKSVGAATATLLSYLSGFLIIRYKVYKNLSFLYNPKITKHLISTLIVSVLMYIFNVNVFHFVRFYEIIGAFLVYVAIYLSILWVANEVSIEEVKKIANNFMKF